MAGNLVISQINGGPIGVVNAIINGNYQINQRGVSGTVTLTAGNYGHDRWKAGSGGCVYTFATANNVTTLTITAGTLVQVIEGLNLISGTYVLSFTGTAQGKIGAGSFSASGVTGTATGGTNLNIEFNTGTVSLVQFEPGSEVSPFERRPIGTELALCQRYYQKFSATAGGDVFCSGMMNSTTTSRNFIPFLVPLRTNPTALEQSGTASDYAIFHGGTVTTCSAVPQFVVATVNGASIAANIASGGTAGNGALLRATATAAYLAWSAEL